MRIVYPQEDGTIAIVTPTGEVPIENVAQAVVPDGVPFRIVEDGMIPKDYTYRDAWRADFTDPDAALVIVINAAKKAEIDALGGALDRVGVD